ncbi:MAG: type I-C CRISPR-associated protein Cas8c/Csd1 [Pseudomonadota bacterium]
MLDQLLKYSLDRGLRPEAGFKAKQVRWVVVFGEDGRYLDVIELGDVADKKNKGRLFDKCPDLSQPEMKAGGVAKSHFLVDSALTVVLLGLEKEKDKKKAEAKHRYFVELLRGAGGDRPFLARAAEGLENPENLAAIRERLVELKAKSTDKVTLSLGPRAALDMDDWWDWWRDFRRDLNAQPGPREKHPASSGALVRCFATGDLITPAPTHPVKISPLADVGGLPGGDVLIGFKQDSFCSYGFSQSANAAVSEDAAVAYAEALNNLIKETGRRIVGTKIVHWFKKKVEKDDNPLHWLEEPPEAEELQARQRARELLSAIRDGRRPDLSENHYHVLTLSGAGGRVVVRDWMEGRFEKLVQAIDAWFSDLGIINRTGTGTAPPPKFLAVLGATVRDLKDLAPPVAAGLWRTAVQNGPIPHALMAGALRRAALDIMKDAPLNHARMGLLKAYHIRKKSLSGGDVMEDEIRIALNENHPSPAYHCGRLMAVLAALQRRALGDVGAGVVQRYYAAASATPALVLGRLTRLSQFHLNKLRTPGLVYWFENRLASIWGKIENAPPRNLNLEDQSLFALGYYQELADLRTKKTVVDEDADQREENNE